MKYKNIREAIFLSRPNRFVANVLVDGEEQKVHVKNTGRCKELLVEGVKVYLEDHEENRRDRKTRYSLIAVEKQYAGLKSGKQLVNIDSQAPNRAVGEALADGTIPLCGMKLPLTRIKPEATYGTSRFDFYVEDKDGNKAFLEIKGVTLEDHGVVRFPDAPTIRGIKHVKELCRAVEDGYCGYVIFVIQMKDVSIFEPNDETHQAFGEALREAINKKVVILAYDCEVTPDSMRISSQVPVKL